MSGDGILIVRAEVPDAERDAFDTWYQEEHLAEALELFNANRAWRSWSKVEDGVHYAFYMFPDVQAALAILNSNALKRLIGTFDKAWGDRVKRSREVVEVTQYLG